MAADRVAAGAKGGKGSAREVRGGVMVLGGGKRPLPAAPAAPFHAANSVSHAAASAAVGSRASVATIGGAALSAFARGAAAAVGGLAATVGGARGGL